MRRSLGSVTFLSMLALVACCCLPSIAFGAAAFHPDASPGIITGEQRSSQKFTVTTGNITCTVASFSGTTSFLETSTISVTPSYSECKAFGVKATVSTSGCSYLFHAEETALLGGVNGSMDINCSAFSAITVTPVGIKCTVKFGSQLGRLWVSFWNSGGPSTDATDISGEFNLESVSYTEEGTECVSSGTHFNGRLQGTATFREYQDSGGIEGLQVGLSVS